MSARMTPIIGPVICHIYRSRRKAETYLYVPEKDVFDAVPAQLRQLVGELDYVMELELHDQRKLVQADVKEVRRLLVDAGYFLQLPPAEWKPG